MSNFCVLLPLRVKFSTMLQFRFVFAAICLFFASSAHAQMRGWELGGWVGGSNYFGDLNTTRRFNQSKPAFGALVKYNFNDRLALGGSANATYLQATDADSENAFERARNLDFQTYLFDATTQLEFNFLPYVHGHRDYFFTPYMAGGFAVYRFNPRTKYDGKWVTLREYGTEGQFQGEEYGITQFAGVGAFGFKIDRSYRWSGFIELSGRKLFTDYLDDVSGNYPDFDDLEAQRGDVSVALSDKSISPKIGESGRQRGNGKKNDTYFFVKLGMTYYFGSIRCPDMGN
jgi:Domain of unknown function (DUF6089)